MSPGTLLIASLLTAPVAIVGILLARRQANLREAVSIGASLLLCAVNLGIYRSWQAGENPELLLGELLPGLELVLRVEPLGLLFALLASILWLVTLIYAIGYMRGHDEHNQTRFYAFFALSIACVMGIAYAGNLITLFLFYEALSLATWPLVVHAGTDKARAGARVYLGVLLSTSIGLFLPAIILTWWFSGSTDFTPGGILPDDLHGGWLAALLVLYVFGIGKAAIMPFHRWLPAAMVAPTPVSALLHAVAVVKAGVFSVAKIGIYIFGLDQLSAAGSREFLLYLTGFTIIAASVIAMQQDNLKARLAYSTVSQLAYITLGVLLAVPAAATGAGMHIAMHAAAKITLFFCAGAILVASHKTRVSELRGLGRQMPLTMGAFFIASLGIVGLPPTGGTWSKWYLLMGSLDAGAWAMAIVLLVSSILNIIYLTMIPVQAFWPVQGAAQERREAPWPCLLAIALTTSATVGLFFFPGGVHALVTQATGG